MASFGISGILKAALLISWVPVVLGLTYLLEVHDSAPGTLGHTIKSWPVASALIPSFGKPTLLFFAHPQCPCTRASIEELDRLVSSVPGKAKLIVIFLKPSSVGDSWNNTDLWTHAKRIPGAQTLADTDGQECRRFGAFTSGTTILFSPTGEELFRGGLTMSRGHEGDSLGLEAISGYLRTNRISLHSTPVFGCALFAQSAPGIKT